MKVPENNQYGLEKKNCKKQFFFFIYWGLMAKLIVKIDKNLEMHHKLCYS